MTACLGAAGFDTIALSEPTGIQGWGVSVLVSPSMPSSEELERIASRGPTGALALCAIAVAVVAAIWFAFYLFAFLPRGLLR